MPRRLAATIAFAFVFTFTACSEVGPKDAVVLLIRHAEKPDTGSGLSPFGEQRAQAYARYFREFTVDTKPLRLDAIFAAADSAESQRPRLTVGPLAKALELPINARYGNDQVAELADELRATQQGRRVLICWRHGEIPELLRALGADPRDLLPDGKWPGPVFDWLIQLSYDHDGRLIPAGTRRIYERLLPGDSR